MRAADSVLERSALPLSEEASSPPPTALPQERRAAAAQNEKKEEAPSEQQKPVRASGLGLLATEDCVNSCAHIIGEILLAPAHRVMGMRWILSMLPLRTWTARTR